MDLKKSKAIDQFLEVLNPLNNISIQYDVELEPEGRVFYKKNKIDFIFKDRLKKKNDLHRIKFLKKFINEKRKSEVNFIAKLKPLSTKRIFNLLECYQRLDEKKSNPFSLTRVQMDVVGSDKTYVNLGTFCGKLEFHLNVSSLSEEEVDWHTLDITTMFADAKIRSTFELSKTFLSMCRIYT